MDAKRAVRREGNRARRASNAVGGGCGTRLAWVLSVSVLDEKIGFGKAEIEPSKV